MMKTITTLVMALAVLSGCASNPKEEKAYACMQKLNNLDLFDESTLKDRRLFCDCLHNPDGGLVCAEFQKQIDLMKKEISIFE